MKLKLLFDFFSYTKTNIYLILQCNNRLRNMIISVLDSVYLNQKTPNTSVSKIGSIIESKINGKKSE